MAYRDLPVPAVARPLPRIDPYRHRDAFVKMLSGLYHAEAAAMQGFMLLTHPRYVQSSELFASACKRLIADESKHLGDIEHMIQLLGGSGVIPPSPIEEKFWRAWRSGTLFALPFKSSIAAAFCLFSEGLGYAFLYNLASATADPAIANLLWDNVKDEVVHLRLSLTVLKRALAQEPHVLTDFLIHMYGYMMTAREPLREQRATLEALGLDFDVVVGSSLRFLFELLHLAVKESGQDNWLWRRLAVAAQGLGQHPNRVRLLHLLMFIPEIPFSRRAVFEWGRASLWLRDIPLTTASEIEASA